MAFTNGFRQPLKKKAKFDNENNYHQNGNVINGNQNGFNKRKISEERKSLPIYNAKQKIIAEIRKNSTTILIGETGSGKTTQIPQFIYEEKLNKNGIIGITQPRRVAAVSLSMRVADEMNVELGKLVGYSVRFDSVTSGETKIQYLTDGMMLREAVREPLLKKYSFVILDEAHERTLHTDIMFGVVKRAQLLRRQKFMEELKIVVMSATMDVDHFSSYFNDAPVVYVEGRQYPVQIMYAAETITDYLHSVLVSIFQLHTQESTDKDFLVFLTGQDEIEQCVRKCREVAKELPMACAKLNVIPLYSALNPQVQMRVFQPRREGIRKVIISTNIAETSLTIPGVSVVIDSGKVKSRIYEPTKGIDMLRVVNVSKAQSCQRSGRAGREGPGVCYRLYKENEYDQLLESTPPEVLRCSLSSAVLEMLAMHIKDINQFDFMDKPKQEAIDAAVRELKLLNAVEEKTDKTLELTQLGKRLVFFPLDPKLSSILIASEKFACTEEALTVVSLMASENVLVTHSVKKEECEAAHRKFFAPEGDLVFLLNVYKAYRNSKHGFNNRDWCQENFINLKHISTVEQVRSQLRDICLQQNVPLVSCGVNYEQLRKAICYGLFLHSAELDPSGMYRLIDSGLNATLHPSSCLFRHKPGFVLYLDLTLTDKLCLRDVTVVDPRWLIEAAPDYFRSKHINCI